jgi:hypothetical protein
VFEDGSGATYKCQCPSGLYGNGHVCNPGDSIPNPKVGFDGLPTEATRTANFCGCTKPSVDQCAGFPTCEAKNTACTIAADGKGPPTCECKPGYVDTPEHGCVDETPPTLKLRCDQNNDGVMKLKQGDNYEEVRRGHEEGGDEETTTGGLHEPTMCKPHDICSGPEQRFSQPLSVY